MTGYYDLLEKLRATLVASPSINTVTTGDLLEVDSETNNLPTSSPDHTERYVLRSRDNV